jgi:hypothetical protein
MTLDAEPIEITLGLVWDFGRDVFVLEASAKPEDRTKRELLKSIFSIFDPLGFLTLIMFQAKFLMQEICRLMFDWDDELFQEIHNRWINLANGLLSRRTCIKPMHFTSSRRRYFNITRIYLATPPKWILVPSYMLALLTGWIRRGQIPHSEIMKNIAEIHDHSAFGAERCSSSRPSRRPSTKGARHHFYKNVLLV